MGTKSQSPFTKNKSHFGGASRDVMRYRIFFLLIILLTYFIYSTVDVVAVVNNGRGENGSINGSRRANSDAASWRRDRVRWIKMKFSRVHRSKTTNNNGNHTTNGYEFVPSNGNTLFLAGGGGGQDLMKADYLYSSNAGRMYDDVNEF